ncbi:MAG: GntR family transcriptional regulator [Firmicutes bacterium]|nr:GntR family transcriptional regulator [Bacillota bacterium]
MPYKSKSGATKHEVLEAIRDKILYLEFKPGEVLLDTSIAKWLNVSRTPVREALLILKREGFVDIFPQSGTFVSLLDIGLIKEILYIRHVAELEIVRGLFKKNVDMKRLQHYIILQELAVNENNQREYVKNDHLFHKEIFGMAGHARAWELIEDIYKHTIRFHMLDFCDRDVFGTSLEEHKMILSCYENRNEKELEKLMNTHHDCGLRTYEELKKKFPSYFK